VALANLELLEPSYLSLVLLAGLVLLELLDLRLLLQWHLQSLVSPVYLVDLKHLVEVLQHLLDLEHLETPENPVRQ